jgi:hypothetical protein
MLKYKLLKNKKPLKDFKKGEMFIDGKEIYRVCSIQKNGEVFDVIPVSKVPKKMIELAYFPGVEYTPITMDAIIVDNNGYFQISDKHIPYELLADGDAFIYENEVHIKIDLNCTLMGTEEEEYGIFETSFYKWNNIFVKLLTPDEIKIWNE